MDSRLFTRFAPTIRSLTHDELAGSPAAFDKLAIAEKGPLRVCYAPFEYLNPEARVVIVGITPGKTQMLNALREARFHLDEGANTETTLRAAKLTGAFSGAMRPHLTAMLDSVGINRWLGVRNCDELFSSESHLVQTASVLRYPVFVGDKNYNGKPNMLRDPLLREQLLQYFGEDVRAFPSAAFIPLGKEVAEALHFLADRNALDKRQILEGMPHPSPANAERIAYFLGKKERARLSSKTNPAIIDQGRALLVRRIEALA